MKNRATNEPVTNIEIIKAINECIKAVGKGSQVWLTKRQILQYVYWFKDDPKGMIENEIDSYMSQYETSDIANALISYGII